MDDETIGIKRDRVILLVEHALVEAGVIASIGAELHHHPSPRRLQPELELTSFLSTT